jgi:hypothetical protein
MAIHKSKSKMNGTDGNETLTEKQNKITGNSGKEGETSKPLSSRDTHH